MEERVLGLNKLVKDAVANGVFPGANYVVVTDDDVYYGSFGNRELVNEVIANDINTIYDMASCTKVVATTTSIILLLEQGLLRLYDSVSLYLPDFKHKNVTVWDLITHTSGLPAGVSRQGVKTKEELIKRIYDLELIYEKNTKIVYSDIGFILLGFIVEKISGVTLDVFTKENIFKPLEMVDSGYLPVDKERCAPTELRDDEIHCGVVKGNVHDENAYILGGVAGHAGLFSTVKDMGNFIKMVLNDGVFNGKQFLSKASIDLLFTPQVKETKGVSLDVNQRGIGWIVRGDYCGAGDIASEQTIHHTGFTGTNVAIDRINRVGFSILSNRVHPSRSNTLVIGWRGRIGNYIISKFGKR